MKSILVILISTLITMTGVYTQTNPSHPNILLIIADDLGVDRTPGYHTGGTLPTTPTLDSLRASGITFENVWSAPKCTPTRGSIMSGQHPIKTGVTGTPGNLDLEHRSIFHAIEDSTDNTYTDGVIGKWHISSPSNPDHPYLHGADYYVGLLGAAVNDYYAWQKTENGETTLCNDYVTSVLTDKAIEWRENQDQPWFLWWAHAAPHDPFHTPPTEMYTISNTDNNVRKYIAMIESIDYSLNRLLSSIPDEVKDNTLIIFVGDNGTPGQVLKDYPPGHGKSTLYQGGVRVPMIISGAGVNRYGEREDALINVSDLYATILQAVGIKLDGGINNSLGFHHLLQGEDGKERDYNFMDFLSQGEGGHIIRDDQYKLIVNVDESQEFYDLLNDSLEFNDLMVSGLSNTQETIRSKLENEATIIRDSWSCNDHIKNGNEEGIDCGGDNCPSCVLSNIDLVNKSHTNVFPNPTSSIVILESDDLDIQSVILYDMKGQEIYSKRNTHNARLTLDLESLDSGIYFIKVNYSSYEEYIKLSKL